MVPPPSPCASCPAPQDDFNPDMCSKYLLSNVYRPGHKLYVLHTIPLTSASALCGVTQQQLSSKQYINNFIQDAYFQVTPCDDEGE